MPVTTRRALLRGTMLSGAAFLVACNVPASTISAAAQASIVSIKAIIVDVQTMIRDKQLTGQELLDANAQVDALTAQVAALNAGSTTPSSAISSVTDILQKLSPYVPLVLQVIGMLAPNSGAARPDTPTQASLRAHLADLRRAAGA